MGILKLALALEPDRAVRVCRNSRVKSCEPVRLPGACRVVDVDTTSQAACASLGQGRSASLARSAVAVAKNKIAGRSVPVLA